MTSPDSSQTNAHARTVEGFGDEWQRFDQGAIHEELRPHFEAYFELFPWDRLPPNAVGFDLGCGTGRWAKFVAPRVGHLHLVDASDKALEVAKSNLAGMSNCTFHHASVDAMPMADDSMDFGYSLGVLHHVPDTAAGIRSCVRKLKSGAPFLLYLYYAFDNRPAWFRALWRTSDYGRRFISRLPGPGRYAASQVVAATLYWPLGRAAALLERLGTDVSAWPLSAYRHRSFYSMRTDALDRFGTQLEQRFTRDEIRHMMEGAGLERISLSDPARGPFWCAVGFKR